MRVGRAAHRGHLLPGGQGRHCCHPRPFGSGKTVMQHALAKWSDVDIVVYIGCGERGNEMSDVLPGVPRAGGPRTGESLMKRTVLIANTSDMPVAAREASVYTGITIAEYFRDMGYAVAVIADSTSRWAEACVRCPDVWRRCPARKAIPLTFLAVLPSSTNGPALSSASVPTRTAGGSLTAVGAVSPPGGDLSEPVSQGHHAYCQGVLGPGRLSGLPPSLPCHQLAELLLPVSGHVKALV